MDGLASLFAGLIFVTVALTALAIGLMTTSDALRQAVRRRNFLVVVLVNTLIVPLVGLAVVGLFDLAPTAEVGVLLCAICAAGPIALKASQIARADLTWALAVTVTLLFLNIASLPLWSAVLLGRVVSMSPGDVVGVLFPAIAVPVALGVAYGARRPENRKWWTAVATAISNVTLVLAVVVGLVDSAKAVLGALSSGVTLVAAVIVVIAGLVGGAVPDEPHRRRANSLATMTERRVSPCSSFLGPSPANPTCSPPWSSSVWCRHRLL